MKKKGFTLVELLGVLMVLAAILLVSLPSITGLLKKQKENTYQSFLNDLYLAAEAYMQSEELYDLSTPSQEAYIKIEDMVRAKYLNSTTINPKTNERVNLQHYVKIVVQDDSTLHYEYVTEAMGYKDAILNGADPVLKEGLIPVILSNNGEVRKADTGKKWYSYVNKEWANAVITKNSYDTYTMNGKVNGATKENGYVHFDGVDDYIDLGLENYDFENSFTLAIRLKFNDLKKQEYFGNWQSAGFGCGMYSDKTIVCNYLDDSVNTYKAIGGTLQPSVGQYYTIVLTSDNSTVRLYIDGVLNQTNSLTGNITASTVPISIGANPNVSSHANFSNIDVESVAIYDRALSEEEIKNGFTNEIEIYSSDKLLKYLNFTNNGYKENEVIPKENVESYFVWVPKYSYQLWDLGDYNSVSNMDPSKVHAIPIKFGLTNTSDSNHGECTTPTEAGETGNCQVGDYMTHPAFLSFNTNGIWVGKFETGYEGATSTVEAQVNNAEASKVIIKPNVYSWRGISLGNAFQTSYEYKRNLESHMMKNTEWGAVAYLQHSSYGSGTSVRVNNNSAYITGYAAAEEPTVGDSATSIEENRYESTDLNMDGIYTKMYNNSVGYLASTTGNITGVYDMSGGAWEQVMGYTTSATTLGASSEITNIYPNFYTNDNWNQYYDKYTSTVNYNYNNRILGDGTGELGPFQNEKAPNGTTYTLSSWYSDYAHFPHASNRPWFYRGGYFDSGSSSGIFAVGRNSGAFGEGYSFRIVLTP